MCNRISSFFLHTEWNVELPIETVGKYYEKTASENINALLKIIDQQSKEGEQHLVLCDELTADKNGDNFTKLLDGVDKPIALMAVNPAAFKMSNAIAIQPPERENVTDAQLKTKHRNAFPIGNLMLHYNEHQQNCNLIKSKYKCLSANKDCQLDASMLASGPIPIWIKQGQTISDLEVLQYILDKLLKFNTFVTLLHSPKKDLNQEIKDFCEKQLWKTCTFWNITGSEGECIISLVEDGYESMETFSRAKNQLVIITK